MRHPLRLTSPATTKLSRWALLAVWCMVVVPGLFHRDPWRGDDATGFGVMWTMATGSWKDWFLPNVVGLGLHDPGPASYWTGAVFIYLWGGWIGADEAARLANLFLAALASLGLWYSVNTLARRPDVQPQMLAFGGQPEPREYGRAIADGALLLMLATLGLLVRTHQTVMEPMIWAASMGALWGMVRSLDKPWQGAILLGGSAALLLLSLGLAAALVPAAAACYLVFFSKDWRTLGVHWLLLAVSVCVALATAWWWATLSVPGGHEYLSSWMKLQVPGWWVVNLDAWAYFLRNATWFWWPIWPMALITIWLWRRQYQAAPFALATAFLGAGFFYWAFGKAPTQVSFVLLVPPVVLLAAFGLPVLKRSVANLIDWFALLGFSMFAFLIWLGWLATMVGWPPKIANNFIKLAPGFVFEFRWIYFMVALLATTWWGWVVYWRIHSRPAVLWRSAVLSSAGIALVWTLSMTLHVEYIDYLKSYRPVSAQIRQHLPAQDCVQTQGVGHAERASLAYLHGIRFGKQCDYLLRYQSSARTAQRVDSMWKPVWEGRRPSERRERFSLYQRTTTISSEYDDTISR